MKVGVVIAAIAIVVYGSDSNSNEQLLKCQHNLTVTISEFAILSCAAESLAGSSSFSSYSELPEQFVKAVDPQVVSIELLKSQTAFQKWYCENIEPAEKVLKAVFGLNFKANAIDFIKCIPKRSGGFIYEDVCVKKSTLAKKLLMVNYKCLVSNYGADEKCLKRLGQKFEDVEKLTHWFCESKDGHEKFAEALTFCPMDGKTKEMTTCLNEGMVKILK